MTDFRALCEELMHEAIYLGELPYEQDMNPELLARVQAALTQPEPILTVEDCSNMDKHWFNFLDEDRPGEITLDGLFTREDLIEIANTVPPTEA